MHVTLAQARPHNVTSLVSYDGRSHLSSFLVSEGIVSPREKCPPRTIFTSEYCPPGQYSLVNIVPPDKMQLSPRTKCNCPPLVNSVPPVGNAVHARNLGKYV